LAASSIENRARAVAVDAKTLKQAQKVCESALPELRKRVETGELSVSIVAAVASMPKMEQVSLANAPEAALRGAVKRAGREGRMAAMAVRTAEARKALHATTALDNLIVIDPPWDFLVRSRITGLDRSAENHYPTMSIAEIEALGALIPAAPDCVLGLWTTVPMMSHAFRILALWDFEYVTTITWNKRTKDMAHVKRGLGYVARNTCEHLIIGKRGNPPWAVSGEQWDSSFDAPARGHSIKPEEPYTFLETQFPNVPKLEMFARRQRDGWEGWGNEVPGGLS
jgi:N6-adenosine-specific RNA methylase IME4